MIQRLALVFTVVATVCAGIHDLYPETHGSSYSVISHHPSGPQLGGETPSLHHQLAPSVEVHSVPTFHYSKALHSVPSAMSHHSEEPYDHHPKYSYKYGVSDKHHGDYKSAEEERDGDVVRGSYTLLQPDGVSRTVKYTVDKKSGFNAVVEYKGKARHPAPSNHHSDQSSHSVPLQISHTPSHTFSHY